MGLKEVFNKNFMTDFNLENNKIKVTLETKKIAKNSAILKIYNTRH